MSQADQNIASPAAQNKSGKPKTKPAASPQGPASRPAQQQARQVVTLETATRICPTLGMANKMSVMFGLDPVDFHAIREATEEHLARSAQAIADNLNEKALEMHMQRIVDAFVRSAHGAGNFYEGKAQVARDLNSKIVNEDRDEDRQGIDGMGNRADRAREFAATVGLQAFALLAAAQGAVDAYAQVCGQDWKPYEGSTGSTRQVTRQAASAQLGAFERD